MPNVPNDEYKIPALTAGILNQGLNNYIPEDGATIFKNVISVSANGANTGAMFYQTSDFTVLQDSYVIDLIHKPKKIDIEYLYLVGALQKSIRFNFDWTNKAGWERIRREKVTLPVRENNSIAFDYMETYIKELEAERIKELEAYLKATGLNDYVLTSEENKVLEDFRNGGAKWSEFRIGDLFEIRPTKNYGLSNSDLMSNSGSSPVVSNTSMNNGIYSYTDRKTTEKGNMVTFSDTTTDEAIFYQRDDYVGYSHIQGMYPKDSDNLWNEENYLYFVSVFKKAVRGKYNYGTKFNRKNAANEIVTLPVINNEPDYELMSKYIKVVKKLVIKGVVEWKDKQIELTKQVI